MNERLRLAGPLAASLVGGLLAATMALAAQDPSREALDSAMQRWTTAVNARDAATLISTMTEDVELLDATAATVTGGDAVTKTLLEVAKRGSLDATSREIAIAGDVAWRVVAFTQTRKDGVVHAHGQALEIWRRVRGKWQLHRQLAAGIIAPANLLSRPSADEPVLDRPRN